MTKKAERCMTQPPLCPCCHLPPSDCTDPQAVMGDVVKDSLLHAIVPHAPTRRAFLQAVGKTTALAAISSLLPLGYLQEAAAYDTLSPEKTKLNVAFLPILCATPLIVAHEFGYYAKHGLSVDLVKRSSWALVRDQLIHGTLDASHFLAPMPLAMTLGVGSPKIPMQVATFQNTNGQALVMATKHKNNKDPKHWRGMRFAIPFEQSMHNYLLRHFLAKYGLDPDRDVSLRLTSPPDMVANLKAGNIDGFFGPEPFNQRAVWEKAGYIHTLSKDIWGGHPCCAFGTSQQFASKYPHTFLALMRAMIEAALVADDPNNRQNLIKALTLPRYLNQPPLVLRQSLGGRFADGAGHIMTAEGRTGFAPLPWYEMGVWMLAQMKRWGYLKKEVNYHSITEQVFALTDAKKQMTLMGYPVAQSPKGIVVMGERF